MISEIALLNNPNPNIVYVSQKFFFSTREEAQFDRTQRGLFQNYCIISCSKLQGFVGDQKMTLHKWSKSKIEPVLN
jgi:hypothetical protein